MGKPVTVLEGLCGHALKFGAQAFDIGCEDGFQRGWAQIDGVRTRIANFMSTGPDAKELDKNLAAAVRKPVLTVLNGRRHIVRVRSCEKHAYEVTIEPAPLLDPSMPPKFTAKQGQYLAYMHYYTKIHRVAPAESDLQRYFQVSAPAIHDMVKTLERNGDRCRRVLLSWSPAVAAAA